MGNRTGKQSITKKLEQPKKPEQPKNLEQAKQSNNLSNQRADLPREKNMQKTMCVSNDRSRHEDQNAYRIIKIGAILGG